MRNDINVIHRVFTMRAFEIRPVLNPRHGAVSFKLWQVRPVEDLQINQWLTIPAAQLHWHATRSGGAGGQNVNKVSTKVDLRFDLESCAALTGSVKARLRAAEKGRLDAKGCIAIASSASRSQSTNLDEALDRHRRMILVALVPPKRRRKTKATRGSHRRRLKAKKQRSDTKKTRGRVDY